MDVYIGTVMLFGFNFPPTGWAACNGALLPISQYQALFALIGTTYGGNGSTNFALPDLRGRTAIGMGQGSGQPSYVIGQTGGATQVSLTVANLAPHTHAGGLNIVTAGRSIAPRTPIAGDYLYTEQTAAPAGPPATVGLVGVATQPTGNGTPVQIMPPFLAMNYCICLQGIYPSRN